MKLLYLHGPPAAGKRTIAHAVRALVGGRYFENNVSIECAKAVLDLDGPGFWELVQSIRVAAFEAAGRHGEPFVIHTSCYSHPEDLAALEAYERVVRQHGGELLPVFLACRRETLDERVGMPDRAALRKLTSRDVLAACLTKWNHVAVPRPNCMVV